MGNRKLVFGSRTEGDKIKQLSAELSEEKQKFRHLESKNSELEKGRSSEVTKLHEQRQITLDLKIEKKEAESRCKSLEDQIIKEGYAITSTGLIGATPSPRAV